MPFSIRPSRRLPLTYFMGFWSLIVLLVLSSGPAYAEWVPVGSADSGTTTIYVDPDTIRRKGDLVKMWQLYDYKTVQTVAGDSLLSMKRFNEYDCMEERTRMLGYTWFSGNMGSGSVASSDSTETKWRPVAPDSVDRGLWKLACGKE